MNLPTGKRELLIVSVLLLVAFVVRFLLFPIPGYKNDTDTFAYWFNTAASIGPRSFYTYVYEANNWVDYPPLNVYIFWAFGSLANSLSLAASNAMTYIIKLVPNLFDLATAFLIFLFVRKRLSFKMALLATSLYAFNPAVVFNAAVWGQFDAIYTFFLVSSLFLISESKPKLAAAFFMLGVLTKPQSIALLPLLVFLIYRKYNWRGLLTSSLTAAGTVLIAILPFEWIGGNPISFLSKIYFGALGMYQATSINAFNFWGLGGMWVPDVPTLEHPNVGFGFITPYLIGWVMFATLALFTIYFLLKSKRPTDEMLMLFAAFVLFFGFFMLPTRIHERYLFPAISILAMMFPFLKKTRVLYAVITGTLLVNQAYVLNALNLSQPYAPNLSGDPVAITVSLINVIAFVYVLALMFGELWGRKWLTPNPTETQVNVSKEANADATVE